MAALLWLGHFPPAAVIVVGIITAFAGYTAVYALNDLVDYRVDRERFSLKQAGEASSRLDEMLMRHPLAQGALSFESGLIWFLAGAAVAHVDAWWLNPFCAVLFLISAGLETLYCKLFRITHFRVIPSAIVKATGGLAGLYAVDPNPSYGFVAVLFLWLAAWEIGGQNIPNDIVDMEDDRLVSARTTLTVKGVPESVFWMIAFASMAAFGGVAIYWLAGPGISAAYSYAAAYIGWGLLIKPAREVYRNPGPTTAAALFNSASYLPPAMLVLVVISILLARLI